MMEKIEKLKQGKIDPNELLKSLTIETSQKITVVKQENIRVNSQQNSIKNEKDISRVHEEK